MAILSINHYINQANSLVTDIRNNRNGYYVFASRSQPWVNSSGGNDDSLVQASNGSIRQIEQSTYKDILFGKLLIDSDVNHLIPRYNWTINTVYSVYDQTDSDLYNKQFYVLTDNYDVYKCIFNNYGEPSTIKPTLREATKGTFKTGDGYIWKYMYTIDPAANSKFTTTNYIPVSVDPYVSGNATPGSIDAIKITNNGNNYQVYETGYLDGLINKYTLKLPDTSSSEDDYYTKSSIYLKSGHGSGQVREIITSNGVNKQIQIDAFNPLDTFAVIEVSNTQGTITTGYYAEQTFSYLNYIHTKGYFNVGNVVKQSDTNANGVIVAANTSVIQVRKTSTESFSLNLPISSTTESGTVKTGTVTVGNVGSCIVSFVVNGGSGYTANAVATISGIGSGATANAQSNSTGKIQTINITAAGSGYLTQPTVTIAAPVSQSFNANIDVTGGSGGGDNSVIALASANRYVVNDLTTYTVDSGNTAIGGLTSGVTYYVDFANTTHIALKSSLAGSRITLTKGLTETGHNFQGVTATGTLYCDNQIVVGSATQLNNSTNGYANGDYIRVSTVLNNNIRRVINNPNTTVLIVDTPFSTLFNVSANPHYKMPVASIVSSIVIYGANGYISNTNLNSVELSISNSSLSGVNFTIGEKVNMTDSAKVNQGANGIISYANSTTAVLSGIFGNWVNESGGTPFFVYGLSTQQLSQISSVRSNPSITIREPDGVFKIGYPIFFKTLSTGTLTGNAVITSSMNLPNEQTEYVIGPTVKITGDGEDAIAVATVNTSANSSKEIVDIDVIDSGWGYTTANIEIYANTTYGSGAVASAIISPVKGHGADTIAELGGRYVGINSKFNSSEYENFKLAGYGTYRQLGILQNPQFKDIKVTVKDFDRAKITLQSATYATAESGWVPGEAVTQVISGVGVTPVQYATGIVVSGNSSSVELKSVKGTFVKNNAVTAWYSNTTANATTSNTDFTIYFPVGNSVAIATQSNSGSYGIITSTVNNTVFFMSNVVGQFADGDTIYETVANAYATVDSIYTANGTVDSSSNFGNHFNQTTRISLTSNNNIPFANNEYVVQEASFATGRVVSAIDDVDLVLTNFSGGSEFVVSSEIATGDTTKKGKVIFSNTSYVKLTDVVGTFTSGLTVSSGGISADISSVRTVLVLNDVSAENPFQASSSNNIVGQTSGAVGICSNHLLIKQPDLVRDSGKVIYLENFAPVTRSREFTHSDEVKLVIKF